MNLKTLFKMQKDFQDDHIELKGNIEERTQKLALCAHSEISSMMEAVNYKMHHKYRDIVINTSSDKVMYEAVDVVRYMIAIMNNWSITPEQFALAYDKKDTYLRMTAEINDKKWNKEPVIIVDLDDVVVDFRICFANWLEEMYNVKIDVESDEYYFISALSSIDVNPEAVFETFMNQGGFARPDINSGAYRYLWDLKNKGYWVQYLTARPGDNLRCVYDTYDWIAKHCLPYDGIAFSTEKFRWCARSEYYKHIEYAIDDSPKHALEYAKHGIVCHVPEKSYNRQTTNIENIYRGKLF
jgi:hypothetical protein